MPNASGVHADFDTYTIFFNTLRTNSFQTLLYASDFGYFFARRWYEEKNLKVVEPELLRKKIRNNAGRGHIDVGAISI